MYDNASKAILLILNNILHITNGKCNMYIWCTYYLYVQTKTCTFLFETYTEGVIISHLLV